MEKHEAVEYIHQALKAQHSPEAIVAELCRRTGAPANLMGAFVAREIAAAQAQVEASLPVRQAPAPAAPTPSTPAFVEEPEEIPPPIDRYAPTTEFVAPPAFMAPPAPINRAEIPGITDQRPPLSGPVQEAELIREVVKKLQGHASENDVILMVCNETGMSWTEAEQFVYKTAQKNRRAIQGRLNWLLIPMGAGVLLGGLVFLFNGLEGIFALYNAMIQQDATAIVAAGSYSYRDFMLAGTGLAMIAGGSYGLFQSFKSFWE